MIFRRSYFPARRSRRQWLNARVELFTSSAHMHALGVNVSEGGMCFFAVANLPVGSQLDVQFRPAHAEEQVRFRGTVRHRALYLYGIEFMADAELTNTSSEDCQSSLKTRHQSWAS